MTVHPPAGPRAFPAAPRATGADAERPRSRARAARTAAASLLVATALAATALPARASEHDPKRAAHPLRVLAYAVHPVGVALDWLIVRPAHWVVERQPFKTIFGHED